MARDEFLRHIDKASSIGTMEVFFENLSINTRIELYDWISRDITRGLEVITQYQKLIEDEKGTLHESDCVDFKLRVIAGHYENIESMKRLNDKFLLLQKVLATKLTIEQPNEPTELKRAPECCICMDNAPNVLIQPCGHFCICEPCSVELKTCPLCRVHITRLLPAILNQ
jgi:hypothetical protein